MTQYFKATALGRAPCCVQKALPVGKVVRGKTKPNEGEFNGGNAAAHSMVEQFDLALLLTLTSTALLPVLGEAISSPSPSPKHGLC